MVNSQKKMQSLNSFLLNLSLNCKQQFPESQIIQYYQKNEISFDKLQNMFYGYYAKFKSTFQNFKQIVALLFLSLRKLQEINRNFNIKDQCEVVLKYSLSFIEDLLTSKMVLVCIYTKQQVKSSIFTNFLFLKKLFDILVPKLLQFNMHQSILCLVEKVNSAVKGRQFICLSFLVQFQFYSSVIQNISSQSQQKFKNLVLSLVDGKRQLLLNGIWGKTENQLNFQQFIYLRQHIQSTKTISLGFANEKTLIYHQKSSNISENWIVQAYQKMPRQNYFTQFNSLKNVVQIYQFLFKLQIFASSPKIQQIDSLIQNQEFLDLFSKFLVGQQLQENQISKPKGLHILEKLRQFRASLQQMQIPYKTLLQDELMKMLLQNFEQQEDGQINRQINSERGLH